MGLKHGYKKTEAGVIPDYWQVKLLPEVCKFRGGKAHEQHISDHGRYVCVNSKFISSDGAVRKYSSANFCPAKKGDVLMVMSDLPNGRALAKAYLVEADDTYAVNQRVCTLSTYRDSPEYLFYVLNRNPYFLKFDDGVNQTHLLNPVFEKCPLALPPTVEEQNAIATALSDVDALLGGLDRLIAKKRDLKQAAMPQLLTGQTRLPGFTGEWEVKRLGDVADVKTGPFGSSLHESDYVRDGTPIITVEHLGEFGVVHSNLPMVSDSDRRRLSAYALQIGDIVFSRVGSVDRNSLIRPPEDGWLFSGRLLRVRPDRQRVLAPFLSYQFHSERFIAAIREVAVGQTMACLNTQILKGILVTLPSLPEQTAIAAVLSDIDAELVTLEARRNKTRALKQAMMQELLTGKTRLVSAGGAHA